MSKTVAFVTLSLLAAVVATVGVASDGTFFSDLWSQLFWLIVGTLATTFVLEAILERDAQTRQRSRDAFACRTFTAEMMKALGEIAGLASPDERLFEAAVSGDAPFEAAIGEAASAIERSPGLDPPAYARYSLDVASGLRDLSRNYIRLFSSNQAEMLVNYRELNELASRWGYIDEFSAGFQLSLASLNAADPDRVAREARVKQQIASTRSLLAKTARQLAALAAKSATRKSIFAD
jgi:hypothetical protein